MIGAVPRGISKADMVASLATYAAAAACWWACCGSGYWWRACRVLGLDVVPIAETSAVPAAGADVHLHRRQDKQRPPLDTASPSPTFTSTTTPGIGAPTSPCRRAAAHFRADPAPRDGHGLLVRDPELPRQRSRKIPPSSSTWLSSSSEMDLSSTYSARRDVPNSTSSFKPSDARKHE